MSRPIDPYSVREIVSEDAHRSIILLQTVLSSHQSDISLRIKCLAKLAAQLDSLPAVRQHDRTKQISAATDMSLLYLLLDRATTYRDLGTARRQSGDAVQAAANFDRATNLLESLLRQTQSQSSKRQIADRAKNSLASMLPQWAEVEDSLGRPSKADKLRQRAQKWKDLYL